jgi:ribosomal protein S12 methylthiotransferase
MINLNQNTLKVALVSLGCPKNQCDAELMLAKIAKAGFLLVSEAGLADVVIVNTCCFIQSAKEEAIEEILEAVSRKNDGINKRIIITGCLSERYKEILIKEFPEVDGILGLADNEDIVEAINTVMLERKVAKFSDLSGHNMEGERLLSTMPHYAYLRIADGCDNRCAYCAIPLFRGKYRSRSMENIVKEARELVQSGVKELILIAQDVTNYGADIYGKIVLSELLIQLTKIDNLKWIRLLYCYPQRVTDELIATIKTQEKIVKYLDIPIQHCNSEILSAMNRQDCNLPQLISKLRHEIPGLILRTTVLTGFPGETQEQFTELAEFVHEIKFEHLGCFAYSLEEGTVAAEMEGQVDEHEKIRRCEIITEQQEIRVGDWSRALIGQVFEVVIEGFDRYCDLYFGRSYMHAPEIDSMIYVSTTSNPTIGQFIKVKITDVVDNNLIGEEIV